MRIAVTDNLKPNFTLYIDWLKRADPDVVLVQLSSARGNLREMETCDGIVLTGGGDVDPRRYGRADASEDVRDVDPDRDDFEFRVIDRAGELGIPLLGICRGLQIVNVAFGGNLIIDLVTAGYHNHRSTPDNEARHEISLVPGTVLGRIIGTSVITVNSSHHQAVGVIGAGLRSSARSPDGVVEGLEWENPEGKQFLLLLQWHPERMKDFESPACRNVLQSFFQEKRKTTLKV